MSPSVHPFLSRADFSRASDHTLVLAGAVVTRKP